MPGLSTVFFAHTAYWMPLPDGMKLCSSNFTYAAALRKHFCDMLLVQMMQIAGRPRENEDVHATEW